ncbi:hypothetical protein QVD99_004898 [Batrachochytrium dendrobatidis]|nr:hypothetical protein O5D80_004657 [Batrachochytrium dendrobatidis]KAK5667848.1 hypothetical protein QVD99_004898 [Batrachochytrium dendrobatidis]
MSTRLVQDLTHLNSTTAEEIAQYLRDQASAGQPFVQIGSRALLVLNIPQSLVFDEKTSNLYGTAITNINKNVESVSNPPPHIYDLATNAFVNMMGKHTDQAIVLCGIDGNGNSQCGKMISKHLCSLSLNATKKSRVISGVNKMETVLAAFGSASNTLNILLARFGRYTEYQYDERGKMIGVKLLDYLFDKDRVVNIPTSERNFDIFYCLLAGATEQERLEWSLTDNSSFTYLNRAGQLTTGPTASTQRDRFDELRQHLKSLGIGTRTQSLLFRTIVAILHLGEIEFENTDGVNEACRVKTRDTLDIVSNLLGVNSDTFEYALTIKTKPVFNEICTVFLSAADSIIQRNEIATTLYSLLFRWVIEHLNTRLCVEESDMCIGVLNFGTFDCGLDEHNGFYTFMMNIANERVATYLFRGYAHRLFELYNEGLVNINPEVLKPTTMLTATDLVWSPDATSVLSIFNSESQKLVGNTSALELKTIQQMHQVCSKNSMYISSGRKEFKIQHYISAVSYDITGFIESNRGMIGPDVVALFRGSAELEVAASTNLFVRNLFSEQNVGTASRTEVMAPGYQSGIPQRRASTLVRRNTKAFAVASDSNGSLTTANPGVDASNLVSTEYSHRKKSGIIPNAAESKRTSKPLPIQTLDLDAALTELEETLDATEIWTVCCVAPNRTVGPADWKYMTSQIKSMDIPRLVDIAKQSAPFAHAYTFNEFVKTYRTVIEQLLSKSDMKDYTNEMLCNAIVSHMAMCGDQGIRQGPNKIFLSDNVWKQFEHIRTTGLPISGINSKNPMSLEGYIQPGLPEKIHENGLDDDRLSEFTSVSRNHQRARSPTYTAERSNSDEVSFDLGPDPLQRREVAKKGDGNTDPIEDDDDDDDDKPGKRKMSRPRCQWLCCTWLLTWWIPSIFLLLCCGMKRPDIRMAWREKVALCIIIFLMCCALLFFIIGFGRLLCPKQEVLSTFELASKSSTTDPWVYANGRVYQISDVLSNHFNSYGIPNFRFAGFLGGDVSPLFYKGGQFSTYCPGLPPPQANWDPLANRPKADSSNYAHLAIDPKSGQPKQYLEFMNKYARARLAYTLEYIAKVASTEHRLIVIHDNVYDVSGYFNADSRFLGPLVEQLFGNFYGKDATPQWKQIQQIDPNSNAYINCMNHMFYIGTVDHRNDFKCQFSNYMLLATSIILVSVVGFKFLAALRFGSSRDPEFHDKFVICQVPCYTEGSDSLSKTLESLAVLQYDDRRKLLFVIADGMIVGSGNDKPTPQIVLDILGVDPNATINSDSFSFQSLGEGDMQHNMGKVYSGLYNVQGHSVPFVVVVKTGKLSERRRPGNRGKRDSQMILMRFLSRVHFNAEMSPLELEIFHHMKNIIGVHPSFYEYILMVDADTEVFPDSLNKLVSTMMHDSKIMGLCGETLLSNEKDSWITMIQVYEYFISHHLSKAFESLFGSVTCLPGCFSMYRIRSPTKSVPLLIAPGIVEDYSLNRVDTLHVKNLLQLGEDRYLTTLMMKHFPNLKLSFNPDAQCRTNAPDRWKVLLSQRRRWINSTVHNLIELLSLEQMCGFCCFSMRFVVFLDLFSTVVQPAGVLYIAYLVYSLITSPDVFPTISIVMLAAVYGFQVIIFVLKRQWAQIGWMIVYILATPVFGFYIPIYSFWRFDDFSWGNTRIVLGEKGGHAKGSTKEFDPKTIPLKKWADVDYDKWDGQSQVSGGLSSCTGVYPPSNSNSIKKSNRLTLTVPVPGYLKYGDGGMLGSARSPQLNSAGTGSSMPSIRADIKDPLLPQGEPLNRQIPSPLPFAPPAQHAPRYDHQAGNLTVPTDEDIIRELRNVLATVDLMVVTKRHVRDDVSRRLGVDLSSRRSDINMFMDQILHGKL